MNAPVNLQRPANHPIGVDVFDAERRNFLKVWVEMLRDPLIAADIKLEEVRGTLSMARSLAALEGVRVDG